MTYKFTHKIEFVYEYIFKGVTYNDSIDYCTIRITDENYESLEEFTKDSELELQINTSESYYTNFVKIIQHLFLFKLFLLVPSPGPPAYTLFFFCLFFCIFFSLNYFFWSLVPGLLPILYLKL